MRVSRSHRRAAAIAPGFSFQDTYSTDVLRVRLSDFLVDGDFYSLLLIISCMTRWVAWMQSSFGRRFVGFGFGFDGLLISQQ